MAPLPATGTPASRKALVAWAAIIFVLSVVPVPRGVPHEIVFMPSDKIAHVCFYAVLGALVIWNLPFEGRLLKWAAAAAAALAFGFMIELLQHFIPWRSFEWKDALADLVGGSAGAVFALLSPRLQLFKLTR